MGMFWLGMIAGWIAGLLTVLAFLRWVYGPFITWKE